MTALPLNGSVTPSDLSVLLAAEVISNGLALVLSDKEIAGWGAALRMAVLAAALLGAFYEGDWRSLRQTSVLARLAGPFQKAEKER